MDEFAVYYEASDEDKVLHVRPYHRIGKDQMVVFVGNLKECRLYVIRHER